MAHNGDTDTKQCGAGDSAADLGLLVLGKKTLNTAEQRSGE